MSNIVHSPAGRAAHAPSQLPSGKKRPAKLTVISVASLKPHKNKRREIPDGGCSGLYLIIQPSGFRSWALRFHHRGGARKSAKLTLGEVDLSKKEHDGAPVLGAPLTLAAARVLATEMLRERRRGVDILAKKRNLRLSQQASNATTFAVMAVEYIERYSKPKTRRWLAQARQLGLCPDTDGKLQLIRKGLAERWHDRPVTDITGDDVFHLIDEVREYGVPGLKRRASGPTGTMARAVHGTLSSLFGWLSEKRRVRSNPCIGVKPPERAAKRERFLSNSEIVTFWRASAGLGYPFGPALQLALLLGNRINEIGGMRRSELSEDGAVWDLPGSRTKNKLPLQLPLPRQARDIIASIKSSGDVIFSTNDGGTPIATWWRAKARLDAAMADVPPWRIHDLRRTAATGMNEIGVAPHIVEAVLNHVSGHKASVAGIYNKASYSSEKQAALQRWADHIDMLVTGRPTANVVTLARKRGRK